MTFVAIGPLRVKVYKVLKGKHDVFNFSDCAYAINKYDYFLCWLELRFLGEKQKYQFI